MRSTLKIFLCIVSFCVSGISFAQNLSDETIGFNAKVVESHLRKRGFDQNHIKEEIAAARAREEANFRAGQKAQQEADQSRQAVLAQGNSNRSTMAIPSSEKAALLALYNGTNGANWSTNLNWDVTDPNAEVTSWNIVNQTGWQGVTIQNGHVTELFAYGLTGTIPDISGLTHLKRLAISVGTITGNLTGILGLPALEELYVSGVNPNVATPQYSVGSLAQLAPLAPTLKLLNFRAINLDESFPAAFFTLNNLETLIFHNCNLHGDISGIGTYFTSLKRLGLSSETFSNTGLPSTFTNLTQLTEFFSGYTNLSQNFNAFSSMPNLTHVCLTSLGMSGPLPAVFSSLSNLQTLIVNYNDITDISAVTSLTNLKILNVDNNDVASIPAGLSNLTNLQVLSWYLNGTPGTLPSFFSNFQNLRHIALAGNNFQGTVPHFEITAAQTAVTIVAIHHQYPSAFAIGNNKFRFVDFATADHTYYKSRNLNTYSTANQQKTDAVQNLTGYTGGSVTFAMSDDGPPTRYTLQDTYQWYKGTYPGGTAISGATQRTYTISGLNNTHNGSYYCLASHPTLTDASSYFTNWVLVRNQIQLTVSTASAPTLGACAETFEGATFPPAGWLVANNGVGTAVEWAEMTTTGFMCLGNKSAYAARENVGPGSIMEDWLITPKVSVPANGELRFFARQQLIGVQGNVEFQIKVAPASQPQGNQGAYSTIQTYTETTFPLNNGVAGDCRELRVDISAYAGQDVYIAFVKKTIQTASATAGDSWMLDNVRVVSSCGQINSVSSSNILQNSVTLSWSSTGAPNYRIEYGLNPLTPGTGTIINTSSTSTTIGFLAAGSRYDFFITPICNNCGEYAGSSMSSAYHIDTLPENYCPGPVNLTVTNYTGTSATFGWTEAGSATSWVIAIETYHPGGGIGPNPTYITTTQNPYNITGLSADSFYKFSVKALCSNNESNWSTTYSGDTSTIDCAKRNEYSQNVKNLFLTMVNELLTIVNNGGTVPNGYTSAAVVAMQPYITDPNAKIYNFTFVNDVVSFSFAPHIGAPKKDVIIHKYGSSYGLMTDVELGYFIAPNYYMDIAPANFQNGNSAISLKHIRFCDINIPCTKNNPKSQQITQLLINLLDHLHETAANGNPIPDGYNCPQLQALAPYITDANPRIYNFVAQPLSFSFHATGKEDEKFDFYTDSWSLVPGVNIASLNIEEYQDPNVYMILDGDISFTNGKKAERARLRHINFCPDDEPNDCPNPVVKQLYINLLNHLHQMVTNGNAVPNGYTCPELTALAPYITDPNPAIYEFNSNPFHFSFHQPVEGEKEKFDVFFEGWPTGPGTDIDDVDLTAFVTPDTFMLSNVKLQNGSTIKDTKIRHIDFCPDSVPDCSMMPMVNQLFINLLNHLHQVVAGGGSIPDGYTCPQLTALAPYITDPNPAIYNFVADPFSFSFHPIVKEEQPRYDVYIEKWGYPGFNITAIDLGNYNNNPDDFTSLNEMVTYASGKKAKIAMVRHINFCPDSDSDCSMMPAINQLFVNLLNHLREVAAGNGNVVPDGYNCAELVALAPYITDPNPRIYNFHPDPFSFSFHPTSKEEQPKYDVYLEKWDFIATGIASINLANFTDSEQFTSLNNMVTLNNGGILEKASVRHIDFCPDSDSDCSNMPMVNQLFIELLNHLHEYATANGGVPNGYDCPQLAALRPYITDPNALIYNFEAKPFSFSFHPIEKEEQPPYDVFIDKWDNYPAPPIATINLANYTTPYNFTNLDTMITLVDGSVLGKASVRHIIFCPPTTIDCELKPQIAKVFKELLNHLHKMVAGGDADDIIDGYDCAALAELRPFLTDPDARIYNFSAEPFYFSFHPVSKNENPPYDVFLSTWDMSQPNSEIDNIDMSNYAGPEVFTNLNFKVTLVNGNVIEQGKVRHINFCPEEINYCITSNPRAAMVKTLFMALLNHLHTMAQGGTPVPDGYTCPQLTALTPYITDKEPKIYNFMPNEFSFSFHPVKHQSEHDVAAPQWSGIASDVTQLDLANYQSAAYFTSLDGKFKLQNGQVLSRAEVRHINFCPDDLCVNHVAIVVDESGSLDDTEKIKIRRQLKNFILQQADTNYNTNGNMHISLIGMSDSDTNNRQDNIMVRKVLQGNIGDMLNWIDDYGLRYGEQGVTPGSDYWKSGLEVALNASRRPDMVIMITDGCQTGDVVGLKNTMAKFDNYYGNEAMSMPHLYVVGINDGFYVHNSTVQDQRLTASAGNTKDGINRANDPNYNPSLSVESFTDEGNVTSSLKLSLKYLLNLPDLAFPQESLNDFRRDYFGHEDFKLIGADYHYLSDRIILAEISCGTPSKQDPCDDCFSFQPEPDKEYILSAWVKEEHRTQVINYPNPMVKLSFINDFKLPICWTDQETQLEVCSLDAYTSGDIIEGWQRIVKKFKVPANTVFIDFELKNMSDDIPAFFDDIRIYPVDGTMKSYVYDPENFRLMSELDENNYATYYEYDNQGGLIRIKKETAEGVKTIQETRSGNYLKVQE